MNVDRIQPATQQFEATKFQEKTVADRITAKVDLFQKGMGRWITENCQHIQDGDVHYYGVNKDHQTQTGSGQPLTIEETRKIFQELKLHILQNMGLPSDTPVIQVVGDSVSFSQGGTAKAKDFLRQQIPANAVVLYGYTGHSDAHGTRCVNAAVTDIVRERGMMDQTAANVVSVHTPMALNEWGCTGPEELKHYVVVYGDARFGDDVTTSDFMTDSLLMLEGGIQSFRQACNALLLDQKITLCTGLRTEQAKSCREPVAYYSDLNWDGRTHTETPYFAAAMFLQEVNKILSATKGSNSDDACVPALNSFFKNYFGKEKCYIADRKRKDYDTKQKLMDDAWELFMNEKLYRKIDGLVTFEN